MTTSEVAARGEPQFDSAEIGALAHLYRGEMYRSKVWRTRVRVFETSFYGPILRGEGVRTDNRWNEILADEYSGLYFHISLLEAMGRRLRRNYCWIFFVQIISYWGKIGIHPTPLASLDQLWERTAVGPFPGQFVLVIGALFYLGLLALGAFTLKGQRAVGRAHRTKDREDRIRRLVAATEAD